MTTYNVRDAFQLLKERGIVRDKQEVRKWLNDGYIQAEPPVNRRVGWQIESEALLDFIRKFEEGAFEHLQKRRSSPFKGTMDHNSDEHDPRTSGNAAVAMDPHLVRIEEEVLELRQTVRALRRELNDFKKVLGFPLLQAAEEKNNYE